MGDVNDDVKQKSSVPDPVPESTWVGSFLSLLLPNISEDRGKRVGKGFALYYFVFGDVGVLFHINFILFWNVDHLVVVCGVAMVGLAIDGIEGGLSILWWIILT